jgi:uncharacterized protein YbcV (DUF1398 family)
MVKILLTTAAFLFVFIIPVQARVLPRFQKTISTASVPAGVGVGARLRADRRAIIVNFSNLNKAAEVSYSLMYETNGETQGVNGSLDLAAGNTATRELVFGTASNGVYRYHTNITNAKLEVTSILSSGQKRIRRFRIKV